MALSLFDYSGFKVTFSHPLFKLTNYRPTCVYVISSYSKHGSYFKENTTLLHENNHLVNAVQYF